MVIFLAKIAKIWKNKHGNCYNLKKIYTKYVKLCFMKGYKMEKQKQAAFSLVELLMALLVASLLMAALAPVMTKKFGENVVVSGTGGVRGDYSRTFYEDFEWTVPGGVNTINITSIGGGGAGGGASYGYKEITSSESNWIVPDGVTKLRVFMTGAGGGGASGGLNANYVQIKGREDGKTYADFLTPGETSFTMTNRTTPALDNRCIASGATKWTTNLTQSEIQNRENVLTEYTPSTDIQAKVTACGGGGGGGNAYHWEENITTGYGSGAGGGSGGYVENIATNITNTNTVYIKIPNGGGCGKGESGNVCDDNIGGIYAGGGGGFGKGTGSSFESGAPGGQYGGSGGNGWGSTDAINAKPGSKGEGTAISYGGEGGCASGYGCGNSGGMGGVWGGGGGGGGKASRFNNEGGSPGGGGGGGPTTITSASGTNENTILFQIGGGGGGGGGGSYVGGKNSAGGGGGGGGYGAGGGGGGGGYTTAASGGNGGGTKQLLNNIIGTGTGHGGRIGVAGVYHRGGGGGGGYGGANGGDGTSIYGTGGIAGVISNSIFDSKKYCSGGSYAERGKQGALRLYYTYPPIKCEYHLATNGGGGGGAGQIWVGEINVVPGQKLNFNIGQGGSIQSNHSSNGNDGSNTYITVNGSTIASVSGGKGGKYESDNTYIANSGGLGGGVKKEDLSSSAKYVDWLNLGNMDNGGLKGSQGNTVANSAGGGAGGNTINKDGRILNGANSVNSKTNGNDAMATNYGTGGSGGGGAGVGLNENPGTGGKGANGYIYVEWGSTNGGGGSSGQVVVEKNVWVTAGTKIQITVGKGGEARDILTSSSDGVIGQFGQKGNDGSDSFITTNEGIKGLAKGGIGGYPGTTNHGKGGNSEGSTTEDKIIPNVAPGIDGNDDNGGRGGSITSELCPLFTSIEGLGGCGGMMLDNDNNMCLDPSSSGNGKNAGKVGGGGGGGAVKDNQAYKGGKGANGMVVIEWSN